MHSRFYPNVKTKFPQPRLIAGSFVTDGSNDPSVTTGPGFSVVHTATGEYTVTLTEAFPQHITAHAELADDNTDSASRAQLRAVSDSAGTITISTQTQDGTSKLFVDTDLTGPIVYFSIWLSDTEQTT